MNFGVLISRFGFPGWHWLTPCHLNLLTCTCLAFKPCCRLPEDRPVLWWSHVPIVDHVLPQIKTSKLVIIQAPTVCAALLAAAEGAAWRSGGFAQLGAQKLQTPASVERWLPMMHP